MKPNKITIEDIYIKLESIFDENESEHSRRLATYKMLNNMLPNWEGYECNEHKEPEIDLHK